MSIPVRKPLCLLPTPLHRLDGVSDDLGMDVWIKRDDLTGFGFGGNKGRKLEYLIPDVLARGADTVITCGSIQSNFIRQLGAACAMVGVRCVAVVMDKPYEYELPEAHGLRAESGNRLLGDILGIDWVVLPNGTWDTLFEELANRAAELRSEGKTVYEIPVGGSTALGAYGFLKAAEEIRADQFDAVIFASSSGSTHSGLLYGLQGTGTQVLGVACDPEPEIAEEFAALGKSLAALASLEVELDATDYSVDFRFVGAGYGIPSDAGQAALEYLAQREGIFLDPIYSAKAFAGLLAMARAGEISGKVCFWHTGGTPAIFAQTDAERSQ